MLQYILLFTFLLICLGAESSHRGFTLSGKNGKGKFVGCLLLLLLLASFRSPIVGNDTEEYIRIFEECERMIRDGTRFEIGYLYYNYFISKLTDNYQVLFLITNVFIFFTYGIIIWKYCQRPKLAFLFFFLFAFGGIMNTTRQFLAFCIMLYSIEYVLERRLFRFILLVLFASLFHTTAMLFLIIYPISYLSINKKTIILFAASAIVGYLLFADLLNFAFSYFTMYEYYSENGSSYFEGTTRVASIVQLCFSSMVFSLGYFAFIRFTTNQWRESKEGKFYALLLLMEMVVVVLDVLSLKVNLIDRLSLYFSGLSFVLISNSINLFPVHRRRMVSVLILGLFFSYSCVTMLLRPNWNRIYPIELVWNF